MTPYLLIIVLALACLGAGAWVLKHKNKELRAWALRKQAALQSEGVQVSRAAQQRLQAMQSEPLKERGQPQERNKFGIPVKRGLPAQKRMGRKQAKAASISAQSARG